MSLLARASTAGLLGIATWLSFAAYGGPSAGDDTFIYMRYVQNVLRGQGYTFNPGEASYGVTSSLWTLLMTPCAALFGNTLATWKSASALLIGGAAALQHGFLTRAGMRPLAAAMVAPVALLDPHLLRWGATGMENGLAALLVVVTAGLVQETARSPSRGLAGALGLSCAALPFTRPELGVLGLLIVAWAWWNAQARGQRVALVSAAAIVALAMLLWTRLQLGSFLPQTAEAKAIFLRQQSATYGLTQALKVMLSGAGAALVVHGLAQRSRTMSAATRAWSIACAVSAVVAVAYLATRNQLVSTRYASYLSTPFVVGASWLLADSTLRGREPWARAWLAVHLAFTAAVATYLFPATRVSELADAREALARMKRLTGPASRVATTEIGLVGFSTDRYIIDLYGLTDRATIAWGRAQGAWSSHDQLEALLVHRGATHYLETFGSEQPLHGSTLTMTPLVELEVRRNNLSAGAVQPHRWRLYALTPRARPRAATTARARPL